MTQTTELTTKEYLDRVVESGLVAGRSLARLLKDHDPEARGAVPAITRTLIEANVLTPYQAKRIAAGLTDELVLNQYEVRDLLGKGGMGSVFLAWDNKKKRDVALKLLRDSRRRDKRSVRRFEREMEVTRRLNHPAIAQAYDAGVADGTHYLALEYVPGTTLYRWTKKRGPASVYWAARWFSTIARALDHAHALGVIHRDIKPSNIIITPEGNAKLLDLGLARWCLDDHNEHKVIGQKKILGSFDYIPPEQARDAARADAKSDIYSLGCVLYFTLTKTPPFHHVPVARDKIRHHQTQKPFPLKRRRRDLPKQFVEVIERMMAKDAEDRFASCGEVADILSDWEKSLRAQTNIDLSLFDPALLAPTGDGKRKASKPK